MSFRSVPNVPRSHALPSVVPSPNVPGSRALHLVVPSRNTPSSHALPSVVPSPTVPREEAIRIVTEFERDGGTWGESSTIGRGVRYCPDDHLRLAM